MIISREQQHKSVHSKINVSSLSPSGIYLLFHKDVEEEKKAVLANNNYTEVAAIILEGLGGKENVASLDNCITRLRMEIKDNTKVNEKKIKSAGSPLPFCSYHHNPSL